MKPWADVQLAHRRVLQRVLWRTRSRGATALQGAIGFAVVGSILAAAIPAFLRDFHASRLAEPLSGLDRLGKASVAYGLAHDGALPGPAPLTPAQVPRGVFVIEAPGTWDHPTWKALAFEPLPNNAPHAFSFGYDRDGETFMAHAHGDLDGDGNTSTFEVRGKSDGHAVTIDPGLTVLSEVE
jgi:hypothetical protein